MTLFDDRRKAILNRQAPLATRMRPRNLDEFVGQQKLVGPGRVVRRMIERDRLHSMILWGPPRQRQDHARAGDFGRDEKLLRRNVGRHFRCTRHPKRSRRRAASRRFYGHPHNPLRRRDPPLLKISARRSATPRRSGDVHPHRSYHRKSVVRGERSVTPPRTRVYTIEPLEDADINRIIDAALGDLERGLAAVNPTLEDEARSFLVAGVEWRRAIGTQRGRGSRGFGCRRRRKAKYHCRVGRAGDREAISLRPASAICTTTPYPPSSKASAPLTRTPPSTIWQE